MSDIFANLALNLPFSRKVELEADRIGLMLMSRACYDPTESVKFWQRMENSPSSGNAGSVPTFLSTHPASKKRIEKLTELMPEAIQIRETSDCFSFFRWK